MSNKNKRYSHLSLPSHEAHPSVCAGEVNKQFVIAIIAVAAIVALALLLLFTDQFAGKAIYFGAADTGGISLVSPKEQPVLKDQPVTLYVGANIKGKTKIINFVLPLPPGLTCSGVTVTNLLTNTFQLTAECKNNEIIYEYYTLGIGDNLDALTGVQDLAEIKFSGIAVGDYQFKIGKFNYFDVDLKKEIPLTAGLFSLNVAECKPGETLCNGKCVNLQTKENCGSCGIVCKDEESCTAGKCVAQCTGDNKMCKVSDTSTACVNIKTSMSHCGNCGNVCNLEKCENGVCIEIKKCGNSIEDSGEECDSPPDNSGFFTKNCNDLGFDGGKIKCTAQCKFDTSDCGAKLVQAEEPKAPVKGCGNNLLDQGEECDSPPDNSGFFTKNCNDLGFDGGLIQCKECKLDTSKCNPKPVVQPVAEEQPAESGGEAGEVATDQPPAAGGTAVGGEAAAGVAGGAGTVATGANVSATAGGTAAAGTVAGAGTTPATTTAGAEASTTAAGAVQQTKISLTDIAPANNIYSTLITATEDFTTEVTVYTVLYGANNKVLSIKLEKIEGGLKKGTSYTATLNYPLGNVNKKSVIVYDVELKPAVYGKLEKAYVVG